ncbi:hypothetical protein L7F22_041738 [Adiantum nelumboides]|nr:hypothetical protein [Adiantum nelumboides]
MSAHTNSQDCVGPCRTPPQLKLYQSIIFATPVLFACLLLVLFCMLYMKRRRDSHNASQARAQLASLGFPLIDYNQGLSISFRRKLPTVPFDASRDDNQCAVCLGEYQIDEKLQELPLCKHLFHISCIDEWLAKNATCPICRTSLTIEQLSSTAGVLERTGEDRRWEERVVSGVQDGSFHVRLDAPVRVDSSGSSDSMAGVLEITLHFSGEHAVNIERS